MPSPLRIAFALLTFVAIAWQLKLHVDASADVVNFFSYFTNLSNGLAATMLVVAASPVARGPAIDLLRGIAVVAIALVGLVFGALLRDADLGALLPWINAVLHFVMPCVVVIDWLLDPPRSRLGGRQLLIALACPTLYLAYVLVRGAATGWYPYPFLNPAKVGGYGGVAAYAIGIAVAFVSVGWALFAIAHRLRARRTSRDSAQSADHPPAFRSAMLELRPTCECCDRPLPADSPDARICSFECTFCADCADGRLHGRCPNCSGELVVRPRRPAAALARHPASTTRVHQPLGCDESA